MRLKIGNLARLAKLTAACASLVGVLAAGVGLAAQAIQAGTEGPS